MRAKVQALVLGARKPKRLFLFTRTLVKNMILDDKLTVPNLKAFLSSRENSTSEKKNDLFGRTAKHFAT